MSADVVWVVRDGNVRGKGDYLAVREGAEFRPERAAAVRFTTRAAAKAVVDDLVPPARVVRLRAVPDASPERESAIADALEVAESALFDLAERGNLGAKLALQKMQPVACALVPKLMEKRSPLLELIARPGLVTLSGRPPHWAMHAIAQSLSDSLGGAPNYVEAVLPKAPAASDDEGRPSAEMELREFVVTVVRKRGKTPSQLRQEALVDLEAAKVRAEAAEELLGHATEFVFGAATVKASWGDARGWAVLFPNHDRPDEVKPSLAGVHGLTRDEAIAKARELAAASTTKEGP